MSTSTTPTSDRRTFITQLASSSAAIAAGSMALNLAPAALGAQPIAGPEGDFSDAWLDKITGKHRQFFDGVTINDGFSLGFAMNFLNANNLAYKMPDSAQTAVIGLRHFAIPIAFKDEIWAKYKIGEFLKLNDPATKQPLTRNMYYHANESELTLPGMTVDKLLARGGIFTVCNVALDLFVALTSKTIGVAPEVARKEWVAGMIPGMNIVAAGVLAVNRAQEKGCTYCYAG